MQSLLGSGTFQMEEKSQLCLGPQTIAWRSCKIHIKQRGWL